MALCNVFNNTRCWLVPWVSNKYKYNDEYGLYMSWWNCIYGDIQLASHTPNMQRHPILNQRSHFQGTNQQRVLLKTLQRAIIDGQYYMFKNDWTIKDEYYICIYLKPCFHHFTCSRLLVFDCFHLFIWSPCQFISFLNDFFQNSMLKLDHITESQHQNKPDILRTKPSTIPRTMTTNN
jgi:hypothetical protein